MTARAGLRGECPVTQRPDARLPERGSLDAQSNTAWMPGGDESGTQMPGRAWLGCPVVDTTSRMPCPNWLGCPETAYSGCLVKLGMDARPRPDAREERPG